MSPIQALAITPLSTAAVQALTPKVTRSLSVSSGLSQESTSSIYSRSADDMLDRLAAQAADATFFLWSAGNVRLDGLDLTIPPCDAAGLVHHLHNDERFEVIQVVALDGDEGDDWKVVVKRTSFLSPPSTPTLL